MFPVETISAKMLDYYVDRSDVVLIDLRSREEYGKSHVKGARNVPYDEFEEMQEYDFPKEKYWFFTVTGAGPALWQPKSWHEKDTKSGL